MNLPLWCLPCTVALFVVPCGAAIVSDPFVLLKPLQKYSFCFLGVLFGAASASMPVPMLRAKLKYPSGFRWTPSLAVISASACMRYAVLAVQGSAVAEQVSNTLKLLTPLATSSLTNVCLS
jgi:hypothetical protein